LVELTVDIYPGKRPSSVGEPPPDGPVGAEPVQLGIRISHRQSRVRFETRVSGRTDRIGPYCWALVSEDLSLFAGRAGADCSDGALDPFALAAPPPRAADATRGARAAARS
jgi:hypothetical protein